MVSARAQARQAARLAAATALGVAALLGWLVFADAAEAGRQTARRTEAVPTLTVRTSAFGTILFDGRGRALYAFTRDHRNGPSRCYEACATAWPVHYAKGKLRAGPGVERSLLGTTTRRDGRTQVTYDGWPLYYYVDDRRPGQVTCQNVAEFGGLWLVVKPSGQLVR